MAFVRDAVSRRLGFPLLLSRFASAFAGRGDELQAKEGLSKGDVRDRRRGLERLDADAHFVAALGAVVDGEAVDR
jgi:hypothetical protein